MNDKPITATLKSVQFNNEHQIYWGYIYGDTKNRFPDGTWVHTSMVLRVDRDEDGIPLFCETLNSRYKLEMKK